MRLEMKQERLLVSRSRCESRSLALLLGAVMACSAHTRPDEAAPSGVLAPPEKSSAPWCAADVHGTDESAHGVAGPFADLNRQFLEANARARAQQCADLEANRLVLRYSFGLLEVHFRGRELTRLYVIPKEYHPVKDVSHAVYLTALLFAEPEGVERNRHNERTLYALDSALTQLRDPTSATAILLPERFHEREVRLLQRSREAVASFSDGGLRPDQKSAYFESVRADLKDNLRDIGIATLEGLHAAVVSARADVAKMDPKAWDSALVIVGVVHQARAREIGIQYFERLLNESVGEGARNERRLVVAEQMSAPADEFGLLAAHLVDQRGASAIFGDPLRLQWDVLGDVDTATLDALFHR